ncbi:MAG: STAS domain-containing protein [bacterium]
MFDVRVNENGEILLFGRFDASQVEKARAVLEHVSQSTIVNFGDLDYISSAGLGVLLGTQKKLNESGASLKLVNMNKHIRDVFRFAGFDTIFEIE